MSVSLTVFGPSEFLNSPHQLVSVGADSTDWKLGVGILISPIHLSWA